MEDNRKLKTMLFGIVDGTNKRGRPCRQWMEDIVSWCKTGLQELNSLAQDCRWWKLITKQAMDTNGCWHHGSWRRRRLHCISCRKWGFTTNDNCSHDKWNTMPSWLWHCSLGIRKSIQSVKTSVIKCWYGYLSGAKWKWFAYDLADATTIESSLASLKSSMVLVPAYPGCLEKEAVKWVTCLST